MVVTSIGTLICLIFVILNKVDSQILPNFQNFLDSVNRVRVSPAIKNLELESLFPSLPFTDKDVNNVKFFLYNSDSHIKEELIVNDLASVNQSKFNPNYPVKILIHGWSQSENSRDFPGLVLDAYLERNTNGSRIHNYNVMSVGWSSMSKEFLYFNSVQYSERVGRRIGEFIVFLKLGLFIPSYSVVHLIGFSLGAQVAGIAGYFVAKATGGIQRIGRITGLDPAGPGFSSKKIHSLRLDSSDADFVDIIHTNMGKLLRGEFGADFIERIGTASFLPNGGSKQPGCELSLLREYSMPRRSGCHHIKSVDYFYQSIRGVKYISCKCQSWEKFTSGQCQCDKLENQAIMGEFANTRSHGKFYLHTK